MVKRWFKAVGLFWKYCVVSGAFYPTVPLKVLWRFAWRMSEYKGGEA